MESNVESTRGFFNDCSPFIDQALQDRNKEHFAGDESSAPASTSEIRNQTSDTGLLFVRGEKSKVSHILNVFSLSGWLSGCQK